MAAESPIRTLVVDDEPLAIERLQILCAREPAIDLVGTASDGEAALRLIEALEPEMLLLDIAMPGLDGIGVARAVEKLDRRPAIVFCTAFDQYAVAAFDLSATDYLLKPVAQDRLGRAVARVIDRRRAPIGDPTPASEYAVEFWVPHRSEMIRIATQDIDRIEAERDYMRLHLGPRSFLLHQTITELERRLDPAQFIRLHRSTIVRRDGISRLSHDGMGVWHAVMKDESRIRIGRTYLPAARTLMGR
ncbi:two component transcriptional regulator, LytTR family [Sphingomonas sp. YR710]|jgi:two-component system response regulator AlgR|uniref:LytR/AlgR family response regulator transcription factor n=1 Tax=Sphingomonas sp. YR710 TaxID=1882773 RepID=UPI00088A5B25|nr:LytTR family DNA-binding domain-containing protein [Sphingomonas sp. YR710]SDC14424.1 two component transcriptional regulator, LytTR family [Sphingomonas sp. YR710]